MTVYEAIKERRSARCFSEREVDPTLLREIIRLAALSPSAANLQPLRYGIVTAPDLREKMFPHIRYAGYIPDWNPTFEQSPRAFIAVFCDSEVRKAEKSECDSGLAMMAISLLAQENGLSSCILGAIDRPEIKEILNAPEWLELMYLIGLGYSNGKSRAYDSDETVKYSLTPDCGFEVPKRSFEKILLLDK